MGSVVVMIALDLQSYTFHFAINYYYRLAGTVLQLVTTWIYGLARRSVCFPQNDPIYFN